MNCNRNFAGSKVVFENNGPQYFSDDDNFFEGIQKLKNEFPKHDIDKYFLTILGAVGLGFDNLDIQSKPTSGNILEINATRKSELGNQNDAFELLKLLSNKETRTIFNYMVPGIGDKLYIANFNIIIKECTNVGAIFDFSNLASFKEPKQKDEQYSEEIMQTIRPLYSRFLKVVFNLGDIDDSRLSENFDCNIIWQVEIDYYGGLSYIKENIKPLLSKGEEKYEQQFEYLPFGKLVSNIFEQSCKLDFIDCLDEVDLYGLVKGDINI